MNKTERQMQFLDIYRQQLRRETEAMGYGQRISDQPNHGPRENARLTSRQIIPTVLVTLGLINKQIQPSS